MLALWLGSSPVPQADLFHKGLAKLDKHHVDHAILADTALNLFKPHSKHLSFLAGPDQEKAHAFEDIWNDTRAKDIFCIRGGYGNLRLLPYLDQAKLKKDPSKKIWGFSDNTILQHYMFSRFQNPWVHSPMLTSPAFVLPNKKERPVWSSLLKETPLTPQMTSHNLKILHGTWKAPKNVRLLGGNLISLVSMLGTPWEPITKDSFILLIEEIDEVGRRLDRALQTLVHSLFFERCEGVVMGHFTNCENGQKIVEDWAKVYNINLAKGLPAGHDRPNIPILMGEKIHLSHTQNSLTLKTPSFSLRR